MSDNLGAPIYCWSLDGEKFHGEFDAREAAPRPDLGGKNHGGAA